ncbi:MAG: site-2 protease family protein [Parachlamydiaceae bacterium]
MFNLIYLIFAILGLSFLIFIHELGHYFMARRVGMRVETFSIGFGRPLVSWMMDGVKWQIGWLLFGGYVRIAGTDTEKNIDPYSVKDGFFGKSPWDRIKVAFMGPFVNILFALLLFSLLWIGGGREKNFSEFSSKIGWIDSKSDAYKNGLRPGDEVLSYDDHPYQNTKDHLYAALTATSTVRMKGNRVNYEAGEKSAFDMRVQPVEHPSSMGKGILTTGVLQPASYIIYNRLANGAENPLPTSSPLNGSGIQYGDRIVWVDGQRVFSQDHLSHILNDGRVLLTIKRGNKVMLARVPRVPIQELRMNSEFKEELVDWQYEAQLNMSRLQKLYMIPYNLTDDGVVENDIRFIDKDSEKEAFPSHPLTSLELPLQPGDRIIAVDGVPVKHSSEILKQIQSRYLSIIVERSKELSQVLPVQETEKEFETEVNSKDIEKIASSIGLEKTIKQSGDLYLLNPVIPRTRSEILADIDGGIELTNSLQEQKQEIEAIEDPEKRNQLLNLIENHEKQLMVGLPAVQDRKVLYNPVPTELFSNVFQEIWRTLSALFTGNLNPKWMSGPIGIIQVVQEQWKLSFSEALYWLGAISLNLGILNLLPIPMLDGGTIVLSFFEIITRRRIKPKTMEKLILPFAILLILFFLFLTYNDVSRIFGRFF